MGFALGPAVGGWVVDHGFLNLHTLFLLDSAISLVAGLVILAFAREARRTVGPTGSAVTQAVQAVRLTLTTPITLAVFGVFGIVYFAYSMANPFLPLLVVRLHGTAGDIGLIFGATAVVGALLSPAAGAAGDRIGFKVVLIAAGALAAASLAELAWAPNFLWLAVGSTVLGAAAATAISMVFSLLATAVPEERRATTLNLVLLPIYFASIIGGVIGAVLVRESLNLVLITSAAVSLAAALLTTRLPSAGRRNQQA
ncbi:MAG TPA: MFS transporter [Candidatus Dormibacteraeota bacterium]|nr:MFS transporter [Candidatus Dormibacteraeota bacterium]